jgi:ribonuclease Z
MIFDLTFLGTSCMVPTKDRNHSGIFLNYNGYGILFDCGENIQRQMKFVNIKPSQIDMIIISHWHGDHTLGLPGLLQTISNTQRTQPLKIFGPKGTKKYFEHMFNAFVFDNKIELEIKEIIKDGLFIKNSDFYLEAIELEHSVPTLGYRFIQNDKRKINKTYVTKYGIQDGPLLGKLQSGENIEFNGKKIKVKDATKIISGKKIGFIWDTVYCEACNKIAQDVDILISEATYTHSLKHKADEFKHLTAQEAGQTASLNNVDKLILTHLSQRYKNDSEILEDAQKVFDNTIVAYDFLKIKI